MLISIPALTAIFTASFGVAATLCQVYSRLMSSQSETANPSNPSSSRRIFFKKKGLAWTGTPFTSPELIMTVEAPAFTASWNGGRNSSLNCLSGM